MVESERDEVSGDTCIILTPNASMTARQIRWLLAVMALVMSAIGLGFASVGAWLVLPFSGAEWLLLAYGFRLAWRQSRQREVISITRETVCVKQECGRFERYHRFQRAWVRLDWREPKPAGPPSRLCLRLHGRGVEIGRFLAEPEREALADELKRVLIDFG